MIHASDHVVTVFENAACTGTGPYGHHDLRFRHLFINLAHHRQILYIHAAGDKKYISMLRIPCIDNAETFHIIERHKTGKDFNIAAVTAGAVIVDEPGGFSDISHVSSPFSGYTLKRQY